MFSLVLAFDYISLLVSGSARLGILKQWLSGDLGSFLNLVPMLVLTMLLVSTSLGYLARRISVRAMLEHERRCIRELVGALHGLTYLPWGEHTQADIVRLVSKDVRQYGRLVDAFFDACLPTALFASALIVLFYLSPSASIGVIALISLFLLIFYRSSRRVANLSLELEASSKQDIETRRSAIAGSLAGSSMIKPMPPEDLDSLTAHPAISRFLSAYGRRAADQL